MFDEMRKAKLADSTTREVKLEGHPALEPASQLLSWATSVDWRISAEGKRRTDPLPPWPSGLPRPIQDPPYSSNEDVADKLFLSAVGYILHHELAHLRLRHSPQRGADSIQQENEADLAAATWLLDGLDEYDNRFIQRALGTAVALLSLAALNVYVPHAGDPSHPAGYDRLTRVLTQFIEDDNHPVWADVGLALETHLHARGLDYDPDRKTVSKRDAVQYYADVISKAHRV